MVEILRQLAQISPGTYLPNLATALSNLGGSLRAVGQHETGLGMAWEAVRSTDSWLRLIPGPTFLTWLEG